MTIALSLMSSMALTMLPLGLGDRSIPAAQAQIVTTSDLWRAVYQIDPTLPLENQYISRATGRVAEQNTLVSRLIRYHTFIKGRPPNYRLDWKLTLADYLDVNERIEPKTYPSSDTLRPSPLEGDKAAIARLNRQQRDALIDALVTVFNTASANAPSEPTSPAAEPSGQPSPAAPPVEPQPSPQPPASSFPRTPQPGDANLLQP